MKLSKCCDAEVKFGMVPDIVGHGLHEETECSNCGELYPKVYDDEEVKEYVVDVQRISYASHTIVVKATSIEEAKELAIEQGMNMVFTESSAEYEIGFCEEKEK